MDTALHLGVISDSRQICATLILRGADPNQVNRQGCTPVFYVRSKRILKLLLRAGADPLIRNRKGQTAFDFLMQPDELGDSGWEFEMKDLLLKAMDSMKVRRYKEQKGGFEDDDGLSSMNSAVHLRTHPSVPYIGEPSLSGGDSQMSTSGSRTGRSIEKIKNKLSIENSEKARSQSAKNLNLVVR